MGKMTSAASPNICAATVAIGLLIGSSVVKAQSQACVHLLVGAGYAAEMRIVSGKYKTDWSSSFPIGKTRCQSLDGVPHGNEFTVKVHAVAGETKDCTPSLTHSSGKGSVTYQAWGTTLGVGCKMPSTETASSLDSSVHPSEKGLKAMKKIKGEGEGSD